MLIKSKMHLYFMIVSFSSWLGIMTLSGCSLIKSTDHADIKALEVKVHSGSDERRIEIHGERYTLADARDFFNKALIKDGTCNYLYVDFNYINANFDFIEAWVEIFELCRNNSIRCEIEIPRSDPGRHP